MASRERGTQNLSWLGFLTHSQLYPWFSLVSSVFWHSKDHQFPLISVGFRIFALILKFQKIIFPLISKNNLDFQKTPKPWQVLHSQHPILAPLDPCISQEAKLLVIHQWRRGSFPETRKLDIMYIHIYIMYIYIYYVYIYKLEQDINWIFPSSFKHSNHVWKWWFPANHVYSFLEKWDITIYFLQQRPLFRVYTFIDRHRETKIVYYGFFIEQTKQNKHQP